jgi:hypothetical protein
MRGKMFLLFAAGGLLALAYAMQSENFDWLDTYRQKMNEERGHADMKKHIESATIPVARLQVLSSAREQYHTASDHTYKRMKAYLNAEHPNKSVRHSGAANMAHHNYRQGGKAGTNLRSKPNPRRM